MEETDAFEYAMQEPEDDQNQQRTQVIDDFDQYYDEDDENEWFDIDPNFTTFCILLIFQID